MNRSPARAQFLADLLTTAVEGGIGYWSLVSDYVWDVPPSEAFVTVWWSDDGDIQECKDLTDEEFTAAPAHHSKTVTIDDMARGLRLYLAREHIPDWLKKDARENEGGGFDSNHADNVFQLATLGEIVYA